MFKCTGGFSHINSPILCLYLCAQYMHTHTHVAHTLTCTCTHSHSWRSGEVAQLERKPAQGHGALSLVGCLLLSVSLDLHQKNILQWHWRMSSVFQTWTSTLHFLPAVSLLQRQQAEPKKKKTHYISVTVDRHVAHLWNMEEFQKVQFNHRAGRGVCHTQVWLWRQRLSVTLLFFFLPCVKSNLKIRLLWQNILMPLSPDKLHTHNPAKWHAAFIISLTFEMSEQGNYFTSVCY